MQTISAEPMTPKHRQQKLWAAAQTFEGLAVLLGVAEDDADFISCTGHWQAMLLG